ncbi:MAG: cell division protein FtsZ [Patescibacteria group bacterium]|jgi:cell division protein FtsZ
MAEFKPEIETCAKIKVIGVGGGGGSAINRMILEKIRGIEFLAVNTDAQALHGSMASVKISIGKAVTRGLGAGMNPEMGRRAVEENATEIRNALAGADMVFLTAGLGGGTGSGAVPEIAKIAREVGALTVAVVTKPFAFEGAQRRRIAEDAHHELAQHVDTIITIPNDRVLQVIDKKTSWTESFRIIDDVLRQGVQGIAEMITVPGQINVDFADVKAIMQNAGSALMGIGRASGESRAVEAAKQAIASPLLEISIDGAKGILFTVAGNSEVSMFEVQEAAKVITGAADDDAKVIFGLIQDDTLGDEVRITVVATGFDSKDHRRAPSLGGEIGIAPKSGWRPQAVEQEPMRRSTNPFTASPSPSPAPVPASVPQPAQEPFSPFGRRPVSQFTASEPAPDTSIPTYNPHPAPGSISQSPVTRTPNAPAPKEDDGEFGIPAFIRRKMM